MQSMMGVVQPISVRMVVVVVSLSLGINVHVSQGSMEHTVRMVSKYLDSRQCKIKKKNMHHCLLGLFADNDVVCSNSQCENGSCCCQLVTGYQLGVPDPLTLGALGFKFLCVIGVTHRLSNCSWVLANFMSHAVWTNLGKKLDLGL